MVDGALRMVNRYSIVSDPDYTYEPFYLLNSTGVELRHSRTGDDIWTDPSFVLEHDEVIC